MTQPKYGLKILEGHFNLTGLILHSLIADNHIKLVSYLNIQSDNYLLTLFSRNPKNLLALANRKSNKLQETCPTRSVAHSSFEFNLKRLLK